MSLTIRATDRKYVTAIVIEAAGQDISADTIQMCLGSWHLPGDWQTPLIVPIARGSLKARLLVGPGGGVVYPVGDYYPWVRIIDSPEDESVLIEEKVSII